MQKSKDAAGYKWVWVLLFGPQPRHDIDSTHHKPTRFLEETQLKLIAHSEKIMVISENTISEVWALIASCLCFVLGLLQSSMAVRS